MYLAETIRTRGPAASRSRRLASIVVLLVGLVTAVVMLVNLIFLTKNPPVFIDEPWNANAAWTLLKTGINFDTIHAGVMDQFGHEWVRLPLIGDALFSLSFALLGLGLFQIRLVSWLFGCVLLILVFLVGRRSYGWLTGALAAVLLALSAPFTQASHYGRHDIMIAVAVMAAFLIVQIALEKDRWWLHLVAGLLIGLSLDVHPNGLFFGVGLGLMYVTIYRTTLMRNRGVWLFAAGVLFGVGYYVIGHVLPDPSAYFAMNKDRFQGSHLLPVLSPIGVLKSIGNEIGRYHFYTNNLEFLLIGASVVYLTMRRTLTDRKLLAFVGASFACFVLFVGNKNDVYAILFYPYFMLMVAETIVSLIRTASSSAPLRVFTAAVLVLFIVSSTMHNVRPLANNRNYDYYAVTDQIREVIPPGARILGLPNWWLGLSDYDYRSSLSLTYYHIYNNYSLTEGLAAIRPQYVIMDSGLRGLLVDEGYFPPGPGFEIYKLPKRELEAFLAEHGTKVEEFQNPWHGTFEIYKIHWDM